MNLASLTIAEAAELFDVDERTVRNWITSNKLAFEGEGKRRRINWRVALPWYVRYRASEIGNAGNGRPSEPDETEVETYEVALARKTRAEADLKELQLARARGEVASIADMERVVSTANLAVQTQLLAIPSQAAPEIIGLTELPAAIRVLTGFVEQALTNLATIDDIRDVSDDEGDDE